MPRRRVDVLLVERGLCDSRARAQALLLAGRVFSGERRLEKPGAELPADAPLEVRGAERYVSRGGVKLEGALHDLGLDVTGLTAVDVGSSTGGFTDCLLQHGAARVVALDVGRGLLHEKLRSDPRVEVREGTNARFVTRDAFAEAPGLVVVDVSFISLGALLPAVASWLEPGGLLLAMVKPQFEAGREVARRRRGVIREPEERLQAIARAREALLRFPFTVLREADSRLPGPRGNLERFLLARRQNTSTQTS